MVYHLVIMGLMLSVESRVQTTPSQLGVGTGWFRIDFHLAIIVFEVPSYNPWMVHLHVMDKNQRYLLACCCETVCSFVGVKSVHLTTRLIVCQRKTDRILWMLTHPSMHCVDIGAQIMGVAVRLSCVDYVWRLFVPHNHRWPCRNLWSRNNLRTYSSG